MLRRTHVWIALTIAGFALSGCARDASSPTPAASDEPATTPAPEVSPTPQNPAPTNCDADDLVDSLQSLVLYDEFSLSQNVIDEVRNLNLWFVDPALDPLAAGDDVARNLAVARFHAAGASQRLEQGDECVSIVFTGLTSIVVDRDYNVWFSGQVSPGDLPQSADPSDADLEAAGERFVVGYARSEATTSAVRPEPAAGACGWPEARDHLRGHFEPGRQNLAFYMAIDDGGVNVWAQWDGPADADAFFADILALRSELSCLNPPLDTFWGIYVDGSGKTILVVAAPGDAVREADDEGLLSQLEVVYPYTPQ
jgi:hypothetical protein